jgi:hypothetical protein
MGKKDEEPNVQQRQHKVQLQPVSLLSEDSTTTTSKYSYSQGVQLNLLIHSFLIATKRHLLSEVRTFEPDALRAVPQQKKNLQNVSDTLAYYSGQFLSLSVKVKLGNVARLDTDEVPEKTGMHTVSVKTVCYELVTSIVTSEQQAEIPIWKSSLMKKRAEHKEPEKVLQTLLPSMIFLNSLYRTGKLVLPR